MENKKINIVLFIILILILVLIIVLIVSYNEAIFKKNNEIQGNTLTSETSSINKQINVVPTMEEKITGNTLWCGTFQLVWNDLKNNIVKQDIKFSPQMDIINNLNNSKFSEEMLSEDDFYKNYGIMSQELKNQIEKDLKNKFGRNTEFLNNFNWNNDNNEIRYFLYSILVKELEFSSPFDDLGTDKFGGNDDSTVSFFGLRSNSNEEARKQVKVLYYNNEKDKAISISTTTNDEILICQTNALQTFSQVYQKIIKESETYKDETDLKNTETLKLPEINVKAERDYEELENKEFETVDGEKIKIDKALQTIEFNLNKQGAKIESEAGMAVSTNGIQENKNRDFSFDDNFIIFVKEKDKELPYFAINIEDIII